MTLWKWSQTAATNATADSTIQWSEGQSPSSVNDSGRAMMAATAKYRDDTSGKIDDGGSSNAYTVSTNEVITSNLDGFRVSFRASSTNTGTATLSVDSQTAKPLRAITGIELSGGEVVDGSVYDAVYRSDTQEWLLVGVAPGIIPSGIIVDYAGSTAPNGWLLCYGQAISRTTYAALFTAIGTTYGSGDGSSTFTLPDKRGRVSAGKDNMGGTSANRLTDQSGGLDGDTLGDTGGEETHTISTAEMPAHDHGGATGQKTAESLSKTFKYLNVAAGGRPVLATDSNSDVTGTESTSLATVPAHTHTISSQGDGGAHNNVQPTIIFNSIIKI